MNDKDRETQLATEFADLIQTLERPEALPYAPVMPSEKKAQLRRQLLTRTERPFLSRRAMGNLWRFAGTAVFVAVVIIIGAYFWGILSNPGQAGPGPVTAPQPTATIEPTVTPTLTAVSSPAIDGTQFGSGLILTETEIVTTPDGLNVALDWYVISPPEEDYLVFFHLLDDQGHLVAQLDQMLITLGFPEEPSELTSTWPEGEAVRKVYLLQVPPEVMPESGQYDLVMGLYDLRTSERLPVTAVGESLLFDNGTAVHLSKWGFGSGSFDGETFSMDEVNSDNRIWLMAFTQKARPSTTSPIEFEVTLGYDLDSAEEVFLKLAYAHPDWQTVAGNGRVPVDDTGDLVILDPNQHIITLTFTGDPAEIEQITGTDAPVFMAQMGYFIDHDDARGREFVFLATETFDSYSIDLASENQIITALESAYLQVVDTQGNGLTVRDSPGGQPLAVADEGLILFVRDDPVGANDNLWWPVRLPDGTEGWVVNDFVEPVAAPEPD